MKPWMSGSEIAKMYTGAANRQKQIKVLAELNACSQNVIIEALARQGIEVPAPKINKQKGVIKIHWSVEQLVELLKLRESGTSQKDIALHFGRSEVAIRNILTKMNPNVVSVQPKNVQEALRIYKSEVA